MTKPFANWDFDDAANAVQAKLLDMRPDFSTLNLGNNGVVHSVFPCKQGLISTLTYLKGRFNFAYLCVSQFRNSVIFPTRRQTNLESVFRITGEGCVLQVFYTVVGLYTVNMVDVMPRWFWANKGSRYQRVNRTVALSGLKTERDVPVTPGRQERFGHVSRLSTTSGPFTSYPAEAGHGIDSGISPTGNWTPFFFFKFFNAKFVGRHGMNLLLRFVSSLGWSGVKPSFQPL